MLINLTDVFTSEGKVATFHVPLEMTSFRSKLGEFAVREKSPAVFTFTNVGRGKVKVDGNVDITFETLCDRCLTEVPTRLNIRFERMVDSPDAPISEHEAVYREGRDMDSMTPDIMQPDFMEEYQLNAETFVYHEILLNWPMKILCKPECRGTCLMCGQNLNDGECGCDTFVPDPRMAAIKDIFNADKEV